MIKRIRKALEERDQGFSMIELLVVAILIGIFAAFAIPRYLQQKEKAVDADIKSDLRNAATIAETIATDDPFSTTAYTQAILTTNDWKSNSTTTFEVSGTPAGGDFCISGWNTAASADAATTQYIYQQNSGGLQKTKSATGCTP